MKRFLPILLGMLLLTTATVSSAYAKDVYVTKKGKKYHTQECRWIKNRETSKMDEEDAVKKGYKPCGCIEREEKKK